MAEMSFEEFVRELRRPLYVWTMAWSDRRTNSGAHTRMTRAQATIEDLVAQYAEQLYDK